MNNNIRIFRSNIFRREIFALFVIIFIAIFFIYYMHFPPIFIIYMTIGFAFFVLLVNYPYIAIFLDIFFVFILESSPINVYSFWSYKIFMILCIIAFFINRIYNQKGIKFGSTTDAMLFLAYIVWSILSCIINQGQYVIIFLFLIISKYLIVFLIINLLDSKRILLSYVIAFIIIGSINNVVGILQVMLRLDWYGWGYRAVGFLQNPNGVGYIETQLMPFIFIMLLFSTKKVPKTILIVLFFLCPITAILSQSRGTILATLITMGGILLVSYRNYFAFIGLLIAGVIVLIFWQEPYTERLRNTFERKELFEESRGYLYKAAIVMIIDHPLFGVGPYRFGEEFKNKYAYKINAPFSRLFVPHNGYLEVMTFAGIPGFLFIMTLIGNWLRRFLKAAKKARDALDNKTNQLCLLMVVAIVGFLIVAAFETLVEIKNFYYFMGLNIAMIAIFSKEEQERDAKLATETEDL